MSNNGDPSPTEGQRFAWLRLNSYGVILGGLCLFSSAQILRPETSPIARFTGLVPTLFPVWQVGYALSGVLLMWGFLRADRFPEILGLVILNLSLLMSTVSTFIYLGWDTPLGQARMLVLLLIGTCSALRMSTLMSKRGLTITIPPVGASPAANVQAQAERREGDPPS